MRLSNLISKNKVKIKSILGSLDTQIKLIALGISIDDEIVVLKNDFKGGVIIAKNENRIVIGRDIASNIEVEVLLKMELKKVKSFSTNLI